MTEARKNIRLEGVFTLKSPLSHIGESISSTSYLVEEMVLQPYGSVEPVFAYSGNAWRGQLRDLMATYMLEALGRPAISLDAFHLLYSGGRIGGTMTTDLEQSRRIRAAIPMLSLLGGGIGNQILQGKLKVGTCYPLCREAIPVLPESLHEVAGQVPYADVTFLKEYSRRDDSKHASGDILQIDSAKKSKKGKDDAAQQMRIRSELVAAGVRLRTWIAALDVTEVELGALTSGLHAFSKAPFIGGQSSRGHGEVDLHYRYVDLDTGETGDFLSVSGGKSLLAPLAVDAKESYDQHLRSTYDQMLQSGKESIVGLLAA